MKTRTKGWLIIAASLVLIGSIIFAGVMTVLKWDFTKLSTFEAETNEYEIGEVYNNISIISQTADIVFAPSESEKSKVVCYEQTNMKHSVSVKENTLTIKLEDTRKWYDHIGIFFKTPKITVYIPKGEYGNLSVMSTTGDVEITKDYKFKSIDISESTGDISCYASALENVKIKTSTGDIRVDNVSVGSLELSVSTGKVTVSGANCEGNVTVNVSTGKAYLTDTMCKNLISSGDTGDISLTNVIAAENFSIERSTGDVKFISCDATELFIDTDTGDVTGSLLSDKVFITDTDTGSVDVPKTVTGGKCEISTDTGNIKITIN